MRKTSKAEFNRFKKAFVEWQEILNLKCYQVYFYHEKLDGYYASIEVNEKGKVADVYYATEMSGNAYRQRAGAEADAKHEAVHLLLHRIGWLGEERYTASDEIHGEAEKLVRILEKVL